ncbi:MAG TPA: response regulator, partial [Thermomicrobiales bacterium]|nr:response regulator [Thermomicrobiales bacterium]
MAELMPEVTPVTTHDTAREYRWEDDRGQRASANAVGEFQATTVRILIVDDDPTIRSVLEALLEDEGFMPVTAANGQEAVAIVRDEPP